MAAAHAERSFIPYPTNRVVGTISSAADVRAAFNELLRGLQ